MENYVHFIGQLEVDSVVVVINLISDLYIIWTYKHTQSLTVTYEHTHNTDEQINNDDHEWIFSKS